MCGWRGAAFERAEGAGVVSIGAYIATNRFKQAAPLQSLGSSTFVGENRAINDEDDYERSL
jgi:hypothetical protein